MSWLFNLFVDCGVIRLTTKERFYFIQNKSKPVAIQYIQGCRCECNVTEDPVPWSPGTGESGEVDDVPNDGNRKNARNKMADGEQKPVGDEQKRGFLVTDALEKTVDAEKGVGDFGEITQVEEKSTCSVDAHRVRREQSEKMVEDVDPSEKDGRLNEGEDDEVGEHVPGCYAHRHPAEQRRTPYLIRHHLGIQKHPANAYRTHGSRHAKR